MIRTSRGPTCLSRARCSGRYPAVSSSSPSNQTRITSSPTPALQLSIGLGPQPPSTAPSLSNPRSRTYPNPTALCLLVPCRPTPSVLSSAPPISRHIILLRPCSTQSPTMCVTPSDQSLLAWERSFTHALCLPLASTLPFAWLLYLRNQCLISVPLVRIHLRDKTILPR